MNLKIISWKIFEISWISPGNLLEFHSQDLVATLLFAHNLSMFINNYNFFFITWYNTTLSMIWDLVDQNLLRIQWENGTPVIVSRKEQGWFLLGCSVNCTKNSSLVFWSWVLSIIIVLVSSCPYTSKLITSKHWIKNPLWRMSEHNYTHNQLKFSRFH